MIQTEKILNSNLSQKQKWKEIEKRTRYYSEPRRVRIIKDKLHIANNLMNQLNIHGTMRDEIEYMITSEFKNFKELSKNYNNEQIIALIIFYNMKSYDNEKQLEKYKIFKKIGLTNKHYMTFVTRLSRYYQTKIPIKIY